MTDIDFILQKTKALKEARAWMLSLNGIDTEFQGLKQATRIAVSKEPNTVWTPGTPECVQISSEEIRRYADAVEALSTTLSFYAKKRQNGRGRLATSALKQAAGILKGEE